MAESLEQLARRCTELYSKGDLAGVVRLGGRLTQHPEAEASHHNLVGMARAQTGDLVGALGCFEQAYRLKPGNADYARHYGWVALQLGQSYHAINALKEAARLAPQAAEHHWLLADALAGAGEMVDALRKYRDALTTDQGCLAAARGLVRTLVHAGRLLEARAESEALLRRFPEDPGLRTFAAQARAGSDRDQALALLREELAREQPTADAVEVVVTEGLLELRAAAVEGAQRVLDQQRGESRARARLQHLLADLFDRGGEYETAFRHYAEGNRVARAVLKARNNLWSRQQAQKSIEQTIQRFPRRLSDVADRFAIDGKVAPLWIMGLPRSGKTLLELILDQHGEIAAGFERGVVGGLLHTAETRAGEPAVELFRRGDTAVQDALQQAQAQRDHEAGGARYQTDTRPANLRFLGFLAATSPQAKFVFIRRDPLDLGFALFAKFFPMMDGWDTSLRDIAHAIHQHHQLMDFWEHRLGDRAIRISYEELVSDEEAVTRRVLDLVGLPWEPALGPPVEAARIASSGREQIGRSRLDRRFVGLAEPYREWLGPLTEELDKLGEWPAGR